MVTHVVDAVRSLVDEVLIVTDTEDNKKELSKIFDSSVKILLDEYNLKSPIVGASTGFKYAKGKYSLLLACDTPLVSAKVLALLLDRSEGYDAVIPKWPSGYIEPLQAVYNTWKAYEASLDAITHKELSMANIINRLKSVLYVSTIDLSRVDPKLYTFLNVNKQGDLVQIDKILKTT